MSLDEYAEFIFAAGFLNDEDPVKKWQVLVKEQRRLIKIISKIKKITIKAKDTDLSLSVQNRKWISCEGKENFPDGEVFTGPEETQVNGHVCFSFPAIYQGREVSGIRLWFENGVVVRSSAAKNEAFLTQMLNTDEGARRLGEFAFGTNFGIQRFIKSIRTGRNDQPDFARGAAVQKMLDACFESDKTGKTLAV